MLPSVLKDMILYNNGVSYIGECGSVTLPKLTRKLEEWRGGGMDGPIKVDMGNEALELEFSCGGPKDDILAQYASTTVGGVMLRFVGAYQNDQTGAYDAYEVFVRGRHEEIDMGDAKPGEAGEFKVKSQLSYYRIEKNGVPLVEIDQLNMVLTVGGVDVLAGRRSALGL